MPRTPVEILITPQQQAVMDLAVKAYAVDVGYACQMITRARTILAKQATFRARMQLREVSKNAVARCQSGPTFTCQSELPCGVGPACRYSTGDFATFDPVPEVLTATRGGKYEQRPQPSPDGTHTTYNVESVVYGWRDVLEGSSGPL